MNSGCKHEHCFQRDPKLLEMFGSHKANTRTTIILAKSLECNLILLSVLTFIYIQLVLSLFRQMLIHFIHCTLHLLGANLHPLKYNTLPLATPTAVNQWVRSEHLVAKLISSKCVSSCSLNYVVDKSKATLCILVSIMAKSGIYISTVVIAMVNKKTRNLPTRSHVCQL